MWRTASGLLTGGAKFEIEARMAWRVPGREDDVEALVLWGGQRKIEEASHLGAWLDRSLRECLGDDVSRIRPIASEDGPQPYPITG
jgi:hypothetical protein